METDVVRIRSGRTATEVVDPDEIREIAQCYKKNGGTLGFKEIELVDKFNLRQAKGMTAYRIVAKFNELTGAAPVVLAAPKIQPVSAVPDEERLAIILARKSANEVPEGCWESYWKGRGLPEPKAAILAGPEFTEQQLEEQAASKAALARLGAGTKKATVHVSLTPEEKAWGTGWKAGFYSTGEPCRFDGKLARSWSLGKQAGRRGLIKYEAAIGGNLPDNALEAGNKPFMAPTERMAAKREDPVEQLAIAS